METKEAVFKTWEDVVFANRNQSYGAYVIRRAYEKRVMLGSGISIALLALLLVFAERTVDRATKIIPPIPDIKERIFLPPPIVEKQTTKSASAQAVKTKAKSKAVKVVTTAVEPMPEEEAVPLIETPVRDIAGDGVMGEVDDNLIGDVTPVKVTGPYDHVEVMPEYEGGLAAMMKFIQKHTRFPSSARKIGIDGTVFVSFIVNGHGEISDVTVLRGIHPDCDREAVRVISKMDRWKGGMQNGIPVPVRMVLPIKFQLR